MITARAVCRCGSHYCEPCRAREAARAWKARNPYQPKPRIGPLTYRAEITRRYRERRERVAQKEYWMIGYDGPRPQPGSWWPRMMEHAQRYGL
jgi:hypothetical protein